MVKKCEASTEKGTSATPLPFVSNPSCLQTEMRVALFFGSCVIKDCVRLTDNAQRPSKTFRANGRHQKSLNVRYYDLSVYCARNDSAATQIKWNAVRMNSWWRIDCIEYDWYEWRYFRLIELKSVCCDFRGVAFNYVWINIDSIPFMSISFGIFECNVGFTSLIGAFDHLILLQYLSKPWIASANSR